MVANESPEGALFVLVYKSLCCKLFQQRLHLFQIARVETSMEQATALYEVS
jgi:hypothetical protein